MSRCWAPFALSVGDHQRVLPKGVRRLIALLALNRDGLDRPTTASLLTPHLAPKNAAGSLPTTLSRLHGTGLRMVETDRSKLRLAPHVTADCWELEALAVRLLEGALEPLAHDDSSDLALELLPEFDDPWVRQERARLRDLGLHALETYGRKQAARGELVAALSMPHRVRAADPSRESAVSALIEIYISQGNVGDVDRAYLDFCDEVSTGFGREPPQALWALVAPFLAAKHDPPDRPAAD